MASSSPSKVTTGESHPPGAGSEVKTSFVENQKVHWSTTEPDFTHFEPLAHISPRRTNIGQVTRRRKRIIFWIKTHFVWIVYLTLFIQLGVNIGVVTAVPGILTSDVRYFRVPMTENVIKSQTISILAACVITHLILGEWYLVRRRAHLEQGDVLGIIGLILLFVTAVSIDACRLIQSHIQLVQLRLDDGLNTPNYNRRCLETYVGLVNDLDRVTITPVQNLINHYQCCGESVGVEESRNLFAPFKPKVANLSMDTLKAEGFRCCRSNCECNAPVGNFTICLTKFLNEMSGVYSATYPIYVVFVMASLSSVTAFLFYNNE